MVVFIKTRVVQFDMIYAQSLNRLVNNVILLHIRVAELSRGSEYQYIGDMVMQKTMS